MSTHEQTPWGFNGNTTRKRKRRTPPQPSRVRPKPPEPDEPEPVEVPQPDRLTSEEFEVEQAQPQNQRPDDRTERDGRRTTVPVAIRNEDPNDPIDEPGNVPDDPNDRYLFIGPRSHSGHRRRLRREPKAPLPKRDGVKGDPISPERCVKIAREYCETGNSIAFTAAQHDVRQTTVRHIVKALVDSDRAFGKKAESHPEDRPKKTTRAGPQTKKASPAAAPIVTSHVFESRPKGGHRRILRSAPKRALPKVSGNEPVSEEFCHEFAAKYCATPEMNIAELSDAEGISRTCGAAIIRSLVDSVRELENPNNRPSLNPADQETIDRIVKKYRSGTYSIRALADEENLKSLDVWRIVAPLGLAATVAAGREQLLTEDTVVAAMKSVERVIRSIDNATPYQAAVIFGILVDKMQLLQGNPTERKEFLFGPADVGDTRFDKLRSVVEQSDRLADRLRSGNARVRLREFGALASVHAPHRSGPRAHRVDRGNADAILTVPTD